MTNSSSEILESMDKEHLIRLVDKLVECNKRLRNRNYKLEQRLNELEDLDKLIESIEEDNNETK